VVPAHRGGGSGRAGRTPRGCAARPGRPGGDTGLDRERVPTLGERRAPAVLRL